MSVILDLTADEIIDDSLQNIVIGQFSSFPQTNQTNTNNLLNSVIDSLKANNTDFISKTIPNTITANHNFTGEITISGGIGGLDKNDVGLSNVDNTSDLSKPISNLTTTALNLKSNV
jgi:hypothetical protein